MVKSCSKQISVHSPRMTWAVISLAVQLLRSCLPVQGVRVGSLVGS